MSNSCGIPVEFCVGFLPKTRRAHSMASQNAVWADSLRSLRRFSQGIRLWHSWGLVLSNSTRKLSKPILANFIREFLEKFGAPVYPRCRTKRGFK